MQEVEVETKLYKLNTCITMIYRLVKEEKQKNSFEVIDGLILEKHRQD